MNFATLEGAKQLLRQPNPKSAGRPVNYHYFMPFAFGAIAAGATGTVGQKFTEAMYVLSALSGEIRDNAGAIVTTQPPLWVSMSVNDGAWQLNEVPFSAIVGTAQNPYWFTDIKPVVGPGSTVTMTIRNASAAIVVPTVVFGGHYLATS